jgi:hypothetical protein
MFPLLMKTGLGGLLLILIGAVEVSRINAVKLGAIL